MYPATHFLQGIFPPLDLPFKREETERECEGTLIFANATLIGRQLKKRR